MKKIILLMAVIGLLNCKGKENHEMENMNAMVADKNVTKLVKTDGIQVAFDFMPMEYHMKMMEQMKADMKYIEGATHGLMVTVMDDATKNILEGAGVKIVITDPDGKVTKHETEIMHGMGMHHYAIHLKADKGKYLVEADISYKGKNYKASTEFIVGK